MREKYKNPMSVAVESKTQEEKETDERLARENEREAFNSVCDNVKDLPIASRDRVIAMVVSFYGVYIGGQ